MATEYRAPIFQGFTMRSSNVDSETAAMFKQLLLRPIAVPNTYEPEDLRVLSAFAPLCHTPEGVLADRGAAGSTAFTRNWVEFSEQQRPEAREAKRRFLDRYEWPSLWETLEV